MRAQTWRRWAGYQMASAYDPHPDREYAAVRNAAALFDVSPLHKYVIAGRDAARLLDRLITRDVTKLKVGQVYYTPWCDAAGKVVDDGTLSRLDETTYRLTSADSSWRWLHMNAVGMDVTIEDVSERLATLALQGPLSRAILATMTPLDLARLKYFRVARTTLRGIPVCDLPHRLHGGPGLRDLGRRRAGAAAVGRLDRGRDAVRHHARGRVGARHRAHRGRA